MKRIVFYFVLIGFGLCNLTAEAQRREVVIKIDTVSPQVFMLTGQGGNIGVYVGEDHVYMIDDQFERLSDKIKTAISSISNKPIKYIFNTHMHGDHTGGNANFNSKAATIIAHDKVRERIEKENVKAIANGRMDEDAAEKKLPEVTFSENMTIHDGDETIISIHVHNAHTDGDALIYFVKNNILHMGDTYFTGRYPYIDLNRGGSATGYIDALKKGLMLSNEDTKIIPGHGKLSNKKELQSFTTMLEDILNKVKREIANGKSLDKVVANKSLTQKYDPVHGGGFINPEKIRETFYKSIKK